MTSDYDVLRIKKEREDNLEAVLKKKEGEKKKKKEEDLPKKKSQTAWWGKSFSPSSR